MAKTKAQTDFQGTKQTSIPDGKGVIRVTGHEELVKSFATSYHFLEKLEKELDEAKAKFRAEAEAALSKAAGGVKRVEFVAENGQCVNVGIPNYEQAGNRLALKEEALAFARAVGLDADTMLETEEQVVVTGTFVAWFKNLIAENYVSKSLPIPDGIQFKTATKLKHEALAKLQNLLSNEDPAVADGAKELLTKGRKAFSVGA